jgi:microcystin-dependent protein
MAEPYIGEIRVFSFGFAPNGWALCDGSVLPKDQNAALFGVLGGRYGGDGVTTFGLPDFQGRTPICFGAGYSLGQKGGEELHTLTSGEMPEHTHVVKATSNTATTDVSQGNVFATAGGDTYASSQTPLAMNAQAVSDIGVGRAHDNMQPYLILNFCIATQGLMPPELPPTPPPPPPPPVTPPLSPEDIRRIQEMLSDLASRMNHLF